MTSPATTTARGDGADEHPVAVVIELESGSLRVVVDPDRGGEIVFIGRPGGPNALFHEAWGTPLPAGRSMTYGSGTLDWLSHYRGGWQVMFPNAGAECTVDGLPHPVHGEVSSAPAEVIEVSADHARHPIGDPPPAPPRAQDLGGPRPARPPRRGTDRERVGPQRGRMPGATTPRSRSRPAHGSTCRPDRCTSMARSTLPTPTSSPVRSGPGRTPACGGAGSRPSTESPTPSSSGSAISPTARQGGPPSAIQRPAGVWALAWDLDAFPHLWLWEQLNGARFPFYGRARLVGIEPVSCWPGDGLARAIERGQARTIGPHGSETGWITLSLFEATTDAVTGVDAAGRVSTTAGAARMEP